ncbi:MAG TPA: hypothetical protein PLQ45_06460 [Anaerohalosphaeraceae bacterium]|jgi:hypothetical protein|nr:hypothetical protein [Anaerohalosphaeraceae bacterium]
MIDHGLLVLVFSPKSSPEGLCGMCETHKKGPCSMEARAFEVLVISFCKSVN